jgi:hypothetical protein
VRTTNPLVPGPPLAQWFGGRKERTIKTWGMVLAVAALIAAVLAFVLLDRAADSTSDIIGLLRTPSPSPAVAKASPDGAAVGERSMSPIDASGPIPPSTPPVYGAGLATTRSDRLPAGETPVDAAADGADSSDARSAGPSALAASNRGPDASTRGVPEAAPAAPAMTAAEAAPVRCGWRTCAKGQQCCNWNCSACIFPGETCPLYCGSPAAPVSAPCGPNTCNVSEVCCNASCGICVPAGGTCSKEPCAGIYVPTSVTCGMNTCNTGQVCCNPSCGICVNPGETCSLDPCS